MEDHIMEPAVELHSLPPVLHKLEKPQIRVC